MDVEDQVGVLDEMGVLDEIGVLDQLDDEGLYAGAAGAPGISAPGTRTGVLTKSLEVCELLRDPSSDRVHPVLAVISAGH